MSNLVRVRVGDVEFNVGAAFAEAENLTVLDESAYNDDGTPRGETGVGGRPRKYRTTVDEEAAKKAPKVGGDGVPAQSWTIPQLKQYAADHGIDLGEAKKKPEILEAIANQISAAAAAKEAEESAENTDNTPSEEE